MSTRVALDILRWSEWIADLQIKCDPLRCNVVAHRTGCETDLHGGGTCGRSAFDELTEKWGQRIPAVIRLPVTTAGGLVANPVDIAAVSRWKPVAKSLGPVRITSKPPAPVASILANTRPAPHRAPSAASTTCITAQWADRCGGYSAHGMTE